MKRFGMVVLLLVFVLVGVGCAGNALAPGGKNNASVSPELTAGKPKAPAAKVSLWVTRDFAQSQLYGDDVALNPDDAVMDILQSNLEVETQYGGGFVQSISGLSSGYTGADKKTRDWFYYVNGIITSVGAQDYKPAAGDIIWWDYHDWGDAAFTPALIGAFPRPFIGGYRGQNPGTLVLTAPGSEQQGQQMARHLEKLGAANVKVEPYEEKLVDGRSKITLVVGLWESLAQGQYWQGAQKQRKKTGLFVELTPDYFATLDGHGDIVNRYRQNAGAIVATGSGMGDATPVWLVTGLDQSGLDQAVQIFTTDPTPLKQCFGALVSDGQVIAVPVVK